MPPREHITTDLSERYQVPRRTITEQEEIQMRNRAATENRVAMREFVRQQEARERQRRRERILREQEQRNWNNIVPASDPRPLTFLGMEAGIFLPPPRPIQRQQAARVTEAQNQQNIQNQQNQPPPPRFL